MIINQLMSPNSQWLSLVLAVPFPPLTGPIHWQVFHKYVRQAEEAQSESDFQCHCKERGDLVFVVIN
jgi:hypothetical protein